MEKEKLPQILEEKLRSDFPSKKILISLVSDINEEGLFGEEWLIALDNRLLVYVVNEIKALCLYNIPFSDIKDIEILDLVGSGAIEVETKSGLHHRVIQYSNAKNSYFYETADDIKNLLKKGKVTGKAASLPKNICGKCGKPIPEDMNKCPRCTDKKKTLLRIIGFAEPYKKLILYILLIMLAGTGFGLAAPYISKLLIDKVLKVNELTGLFDSALWLGPLCLVLLISYGGQLFFAGWQERLSGALGYKTVYDVRAAVYSRLQNLSLSFFDKYQTGAILARVNQDTGELQRFLVDFVPLTLEGIFMLFGVGTFLFILSWELTLWILIPVILTVMFLKWIFPRVWSYFHRYFHKRSVLSALVNDSLSGMRVIKAFGQENFETGKFNRKSADYREAGIELTNQWSVYHPILHFFIMIGAVIVWYIGGKFVLLKTMTIGSVVAYSGYLMMFYRPVFILTRMVEMITNSLAAAERVFDIIDTEPDVKDAPDALSMPDIKGSIEFKNAVFGYNRFKPVIKNMTLKIDANEIIGLVGRSGAGKSTFINLVCRLYDVNKGEILIDGVNLKKIRQADLRNQVGIVLQEPFLFNGTIYDNISYAKQHATKEEVLAASIAANAHEFILKKPDGYDTYVGERGNNLSGGEKQMVSIARAILRNPKILILDEATSSVDVQTEKKIQDALDKLIKNRTTIAIAHRLSTLRKCSRLVVIKDGKIREVGNHRELMAKKGIFYRLVKIQQEFTSELSNVKAV